MDPLFIDCLNAPDVQALALSNDEILAAVEAGLAAQGCGETVIEPRMHLLPGSAYNGHFNVLRGYVGPLQLAGVKVVGDLVDNWQQGLPSEMGLLNLFDPATGRPLAIVDAAGLTDMRTGAVTAIGAKHLARRSSKVLAHIGARGTAYWNVRLLDHVFDFDEIRVHSRRQQSRDAFADRLTRDLGKPVIATTDWASCVKRLALIDARSAMVPALGSTPTQAIAPEVSLRDALATMLSANVDALAVVDASGQALGVLTLAGLRERTQIARQCDPPR